MCAIAGIYFKRQTPESLRSQQTSAYLPKMLESLAHRGDLQSDWKSYGQVALGMNRLAIINRNLDSIPYSNETETAFVAFNGEIYNQREIRSALKEKHTFRSQTDSEVLVHAYEEKGIDFIHDLNGMFTFALYDSMEKTLHLVRDRAGEKFLYYYVDDEKLLFASEIKAILRWVRPEEISNLTYDFFEACFGQETLFKGIRLLEPGHRLKIHQDKIEDIEYWSALKPSVTVPNDIEKAEKELTELLIDSVELRLRNSAFPPSVLVSGGIDSGLIAAIAKPEFLYTCTYEEFGEEFCELPYAQAIAEHIGKPLAIVRPTKADFHQYRKRIAYHLDTPCTWTSFNLFMTFQRAAKDTKVVLTGEGVDEVFGGYHRYHLLHHDQQIHRLAALDNYSYLIQRYYGSSAERYARLISRSEKVNHPEFRQYLLDLITPYFDAFPENVLHAMGACDLYTTLQIILQMGDRMSMAHTIENRAPFLDYRLIEFGFAMPERFKIDQGITKYLIKRIAKKFLPEAVSQRLDKRGFLLPFNLWFQSVGNKYDRTQFSRMSYSDWKEVFLRKDSKGPSLKLRSPALQEGRTWPENQSEPLR